MRKTKGREPGCLPRIIPPVALRSLPERGFMCQVELAHGGFAPGAEREMISHQLWAQVEALLSPIKSRTSSLSETNYYADLIFTKAVDVKILL